MKKVKVEMGYKAIAAVAKELGINPVGKKTEVLVDMVNTKIDELKVQQKAQKVDNAPKAKWYDNGYGFQIGEIAIITEAHRMVKGVPVPILKGRQVCIVKPAKTEGKVKARLINPKTGELQNVLITVGINQLQKVFQLESPKAM